MKIHIQPVFVAASLLALGGIVLGVRAIFPASRGQPPPPRHNQGDNSSDSDANGGEPVAEWFSEPALVARFIEPTPESVVAIVREAASSAASQLMLLAPGTELDESRRSALVSSFAESLQLQLNPDFDAHNKMIAKLGGTTPYLAGGNTADSYRSAVLSASFVTAMAPVAADAVRVRARFVHGRAIPVEGRPQNLNLSAPEMFPIPKDAEKNALDVYEVLVPMKLPTVGRLGKPEGREAFAVGFGYAWSLQRHAWLPWRIWVYSPNNDTQTYPPVFP